MLISCVAAAAAVLSAVLCACTGAFGGYGWLWMLPVGFLGFFLLLAGLAFLFLYVMCAFVRMDKPQETDSPFYRRMMYLYEHAALTILGVRLKKTGMEQTPQQGRFLLVCNHLNILDPLVLHLCFEKSQLAYISKRENDSMLIIGKLMHKTLCQPINRENDREALRTILKCIQLIKEDKVSVAVFPEGYTSLDEKLHPFRSGVFKIAQKANVPVVVCTLQNTQHVFRNFAHLRRTDVPVHLLGVIPAEETKGITAVELGERVHAMMAADLGPENVLSAD